MFICRLRRCRLEYMSVLEGGQSRLEGSGNKELHGYHNVMASAQSDFAASQ